MVQNKPISELQDLIEAPLEREGLELKSWLDFSDKTSPHRANIARHIAALANHGGGYLIFGFNDDGSRCAADANVRTHYSHDIIAGIIDRYLNPKFQCDVYFEESNNVLHPIVWVPPHGAVPIIAKADGPQDQKGSPQGIRSGYVYIRTPKPESVPITSPEHWDKLIQRCVLARRDELVSMFSGIISGTTSSSLETKTLEDRLTEWHQALKNAFLNEIKEKDVQSRYPLADNNIQFSYLLIGSENQYLPAEKLLEVIDRSNKAVRDTVRYGWSMFYPFTREEIMPRFMTDSSIDKGQTEFTQTSLIGNSTTSNLDLWRISLDGRVSLIRNFHEDRFQTPPSLQDGEKWFDPWLQIRDLTELVRHAQAMAEEFENIDRVVFKIEWKGLDGRKFASTNHDRYFTQAQCRGDQRTVSMSFTLPEIIGDLPSVVGRLYAPIHRMFDPRYEVKADWVSKFLPSFIVHGL